MDVVVPLVHQPRRPAARGAWRTGSDASWARSGKPLGRTGAASCRSPEPRSVARLPPIPPSTPPCGPSRGASAAPANSSAVRNTDAMSSAIRCAFCRDVLQILVMSVWSTVNLVGSGRDKRPLKASHTNAYARAATPMTSAQVWKTLQ